MEALKEPEKPHHPETEDKALDSVEERDHGMGEGTEIYAKRSKWLRNESDGQL